MEHTASQEEQREVYRGSVLDEPFLTIILLLLLLWWKYNDLIDKGKNTQRENRGN